MKLEHSDRTMASVMSTTVERLHRTDIGRRVALRGWVKTRRTSKAGISFIHVTDGSDPRPFQVVVDSSIKNYDEVLKLTTGCSIFVIGKIVESKGREQDSELLAEKVYVIGWVEDPATYPVQPKKHSQEFLRSIAHLRPRTDTFASVMRVRNELARNTHDFFQGHGFKWIHTPIITGSDCEGAGEMFRVSTLDMSSPPMKDGKVDYSKDFFKGEAHLTVSGQLNVEPFACSMGRVYTFGPTFRAENSNTSRHLSEFWMVEPEIAFADIDEDIYWATEYLQDLARHCLDYSYRDLESLEKAFGEPVLDRLEILYKQAPEILTYTEAIDILLAAKAKFDFPVKWGIDLQSEHEKYLCDYAGGRPVVVRDYPKEIKAFYMRLNDDERTVAAMDVLIPGVGEIIGGSQREERLDVLTQRMIDSDLVPEEYSWYLDLRRYGSIPHSGFGLGFERAVQYFTGTKNIRDTIPYPRAPGKIDF